MPLDDIIISKTIIESFKQKLLDGLEADVAIAGGGPAGLTAAYFLAKAGKKVTLFERKLSIGGGMWGGGMMFNDIVVQKSGQEILDEFGVKTIEKESGYFVADSIEAVTTIASKAVKAGVKIFNLISVEDVMIRGNKITGLVLNWTAVEMAKLHVDPLTVGARYVIDATGHAAEVAQIITRKIGPKLKTRGGKLVGEQSMWAEVGEETIVKNTKEMYVGAYVAGMAANAVFGGPRMGPIFGGMLLSGKKAAEIIALRLK